MPAAQLRMTGRVQGVSYRASTRTAALKLGLTGWVRNEADGSVAAMVQGPRAAVDSLIAWCYDGPQHASVDTVKVTWVEEDVVVRGFEIR